MVLSALERQGSLRTDGRRVCRHYREPYRWLTGQMRRRGIDHPKARYPLWAWYQYDGENRRRPDLRGGCFAESGTEMVRLEIEVPASEVLLSDFELWHYVLGFSYLPISDADRRRFARTHPEPRGLIAEQRARSSATRRRLIEKSWEKIFDLDWSLKDYSMPRSKKGIQSTFWELQFDWVVSVQHFVAR